jgi:cyclopropane-fatty-acyl-phospholipid synthase
MWCETDALMADHYDADLRLFAAFLDQRYMAYSMAYYGETPEAIRASDASLEQAQRAKLALICERSGIRDDHRLLDIGCGFGALETFIAEAHPEARVTAVTPSRTQIEYIEARRRDSRHMLSRGFVDLRQGDFTTLDLPPRSYDVVCSIGAFEHVNNLTAALARIAGLLRPGGTCLLHLISSIVAIPRLLDPNGTLVAGYFPGGKVWPFATLAASRADLELDACWFLNGLNYWRTLDVWHRHLWNNMDRVYGQIFGADGVRHWNQFFSLSKACFTPADGTVVGVGQFLFRKRTWSRLTAPQSA